MNRPGAQQQQSWCLTRELPIETVRRCYAEEVCFTAGVRSRALAEAFATVPRERYLGPGPWQILTLNRHGDCSTTTDADPRRLYHDVLVAIDPARHLNNGQPSALAVWLDALDLQPGDRVFHIGCGLGYYTAIIAHVVGGKGSVVAIEVDPDLAMRARANLAHLARVDVVGGDGVSYDPGGVDAIFVNAGVTHPQSLWLDCLRPHGRLLVPLTVTSFLWGISEEMNAGGGQMLLVRRVDDEYQASFVSTVGIYASPSGRDEKINEALGRAYKETGFARRPPVQSLRRDRHKADETCWLHASDFCLSKRAIAAATTV